VWTQEDLAVAARFNDWAWISIEPERADAQGQRWLLIRRNTTGELAYYRCW
jgi:GAF domain-containing protein